MNLLKKGGVLVEDSTRKENESKKKLYQTFLFIGVILIALNLRPAITSVGPIIGFIRDDVGFANWSVAMLTSLPLVAFAVMSPVAPKLANKLTREKTLVLGLFVLLCGISIRSVPMIFSIYIGTLCIGLGIAICNVLLPGVIKEQFPTKISLITGIYSTAMGVSATVASGLSIPLIESEIGWEITLLVWIIPALLAIIVWLLISKVTIGSGKVKSSYLTKNKVGIWKSVLAWKIAMFMGLQSLLFYITITWLPEILIDFGMNKASAGLMLSYLQLMGLPASFIIPVLAGKLESQRFLVITLNIFLIIGILILMIGNGSKLFMIAITLMGISLSGNFTLALLFLSIRAGTANHAAQLSGMAQSIGYLLAATGPMLIGLIYDLTQKWGISLVILICIALCSSLLGMSVGRNKYVLANQIKEENALNIDISK